MKKYIFFAPNIHIIGGGQLYVAGKAKYLESHGWQVFIFYTAGKNYGESEIPQLTKYVYGCSFGELSFVSYKVKKEYRESVFQRMLDILRIDETVENEIVIESMMDRYASWAELLAEKIHARHFFTLIEESYREHNPQQQEYENDLDFFYFKYKRNELLYSQATLQNLFLGYPDTEEYRLTVPDEFMFCREQDPIQDVENEIVDKIQRAELNIAYIGRTNKKYVSTIIKEVAEFVKNHPDKQFQFSIIGTIYEQKKADLIYSLFQNLNNCSVDARGSLIPIPRSLFKKLDVVIAGSQTAVFCSYEHVTVIVANAESDKTAGCLFYDTDDDLFAEPKYSYAEMLEKVLINHEYDNRQPNLPDRKPAEWYYEKSLEIQFSQCSPKLEYFTEKFNSNLWRTYILQFPFEMIPQGSKVVIYGANEFTRDYIQQIRDGNYCKLIGIVADDHMHFDKTVQPPENLNQLDYDVIVIAGHKDIQKVYDIIENIKKITGKNNYIYTWKEIRL